MSTTTFTSTSPAALKVWARKTLADSVKNTLYGKLVGTSDRAIVQMKDELKKGEGDRVRFQLRSLPTGIGVQDDETLEGKEEGLDYRYFDLNLGEKRHAIKVDLNLSAQRTMFNVQQDAKDALGEWIEEYLDTTFFEYMTGAGVGAAGASKYHPSGALGGNALTAPASDRIIYPGTATSKATVAVTDTMSLAVLDKVAERLKRASPTMRKASYDGKTCYLVIMSPEQVNDLRSNTSVGQWLDIQKAVTQGGGDGLLFKESLGMYRDMLLIESVRVPIFLDYGAGTNIQAHRALVLGAQACVAAHGNGTDDQGRLKVVDRSFDYGKRYGVSATLIWGMQKTVFNNQSDFGVFSVDTAAKPHS